MKEKLEYLMSQTGLRSGQIAKMLDVKASVVSHLLIGRNQPNYKLTAKIIKVFSDYSPLWWLGLSDDPYAKVTTFVGSQNSETSQVGEQATPPTSTAEEPTLFETQSSSSSAKPTLPAGQGAAVGSLPSSEIERVIVIYRDKSFESFTPKK